MLPFLWHECLCGLRAASLDCGLTPTTAGLTFQSAVSGGQTLM